MAKALFVNPAFETTLAWDIFRTGRPLGQGFLASKLRENGHSASVINEMIRGGGFDNKYTFRRVLDGDRVTEIPLEIRADEYFNQKMQDFDSLSPEDFVEKYTAFRDDGSIVRDMVRIGRPLEETLAEIERERPDLVCIPIIATANYPSAIKLGEAIKRIFPHIRIVTGGQHITADPEGFLKENPWADIAVKDDGISSIVDIVEGREKGPIVRGGFVPFNEFPLLDPRVYDDEYPIPPLHSMPTDGRKYMDWMFTKGCFRHCNFCMAGSQKGNRVSPFDYDKLDEQMRIFREQGYRELILQDDALLWDPKHMKDHLPKIFGIMKKYGFFWHDSGGVDFRVLTDFATEQILDYNKGGEGRVTSLYVPFNPEGGNVSASGSQIREHRRNFENIQRLIANGLYIVTSEIIGTPEHTPEVIEQDIELHKQLLINREVHFVLTLIATTLPGTEWYKENSHNIINKLDHPGYSLFVPNSRTEHIPDPRMIEYYAIKRMQALDPHQVTFSWCTGYSNFPGKNTHIEQCLRKR